MKPKLLYKICDIGNERDKNEDNIFSDEKNFIFSISDGMGGASYGEEASKICIDSIDTDLTLKDMITKANEKVLKLQQEKTINIGATFDILKIKDNFAKFVHVGDSRIYLFRDELKLLTLDHSVAGGLYKIGEIKTLEEVRIHPMSNSLLNYIGKKNIQIDEDKIELQKGDILLLCSDGFSDSLPHKKIEELIIKYRYKNLGEKLFKSAIEADNRDNLSLILIEIED